MTDQAHLVHTATLALPAMTFPICAYCLTPIHTVAGGHGKHWVHSNDGHTVCAPGHVTIEFRAWDQIPEHMRRIGDDGEREVLGVTFNGEPTWLPHMVNGDA